MGRKRRKPKAAHGGPGPNAHAAGGGEDPEDEGANACSALANDGAVVPPATPQPRSRLQSAPGPSPAEEPWFALSHEDPLIEQGYALFVRFQYTQAIGVLKQCKGSSIALGYHAVMLWVGGGGVVQDRTAAKILARRALAAGIASKVESGDRHAQFIVGYLHYNSEVVEQDHGKCVRLWWLAADQGHSGALHCLGNWFDYGAPEPDKAKAVEMYTRSAETGNPAAQTDLGTCYQNGEGVEKDEKRAFALFRAAAEYGFALAQNNLGHSYLTGNGTERNEERAIALYTAAARQGNALALRNLGWCYQNGLGVPQDLKRCAELYGEAAAQGNAPAQLELSRCYFHGIGVRANTAKAHHYAHLSALQGHEPALHVYMEFERLAQENRAPKAAKEKKNKQKKRR